MEKTKETKPPKTGRFYRIGFFILLAVLALTVWRNYDYWAFKLLIADAYIFTDTLDTAYTQAIGAENYKSYHGDFDRFMMAAVTEKIRSINGDRYTYLYTPQSYAESKTAEAADAKRTHHTALTDDTVYLYLANISEGTRRYVYDHRAELRVYKNLVLDMRGNYGGLLADFYRMAELFTEKGAVLGREITRFPFLTHAVVSEDTPYFAFERIVILQDGATASAAEGLIQALRANRPGTVTLGEKTFGKGIGQVTVPLTGGYAVKATVLLVTAPDGSSVHNAGITPDVTGGAGDWIAQAVTLLDGPHD